MQRTNEDASQARREEPSDGPRADQRLTFLSIGGISGLGSRTYVRESGIPRVCPFDLARRRRTGRGRWAGPTDSPSRNRNTLPNRESFRRGAHGYISFFWQSEQEIDRMGQKSYLTNPRYCKTCGMTTPHELRRCAGATVQICRRCLERVFSHLNDARSGRRNRVSR